MNQTVPPAPTDRPHVRPHFDLRVAAPVQDVKAQLEAHFAGGGEMWAGHIVGHHAQLVIRRKNRHIWSPWLTFAIESPEGEDAATYLHGRFAPHPSGWTLYLAAYGIVIISMLGLGFFGVSQWMAGLPAYMLWSFPGGMVLVAALYGTAFIGQSLAAGEMDAMRAFVLEALSDWEKEWVAPPERPDDDTEQVG